MAEPIRNYTVVSQTTPGAPPALDYGYAAPPDGGDAIADDSTEGPRASARIPESPEARFARESFANSPLFAALAKHRIHGPTGINNTPKEWR